MVRVTLVEAKEILSSFDHKLRDYTKRIIKKRSNMSIHKASVTGIYIQHPHRLALKSH